MAKLQLGAAISLTMQAKDLTVEQIVERSKLKKESVERYMDGSGTPTLTKFLKLANGLGVDPKSLFDAALVE